MIKDQKNFIIELNNFFNEDEDMVLVEINVKDPYSKTSKINGVMGKYHHGSSALRSSKRKVKIVQYFKKLLSQEITDLIVENKNFKEHSSSFKMDSDEVDSITFVIDKKTAQKLNIVELNKVEIKKKLAAL